MDLRHDRLTELLLRLREAYEVGSPTIVQQRLLSDFFACLSLRGATPPPFQAPLSEEFLLALESRFSQIASRRVTTTH